MIICMCATGMTCRAAGKLGMALAFFNRYLDISEAIDDDDPAGSGVNDFRMFTGIPRTAPLPVSHYAPEHAREEVSALARVSEARDQRQHTMTHVGITLQIDHF